MYVFAGCNGAGKSAVSLADVSVIFDNSGEHHKVLIEIVDGEVLYKSRLFPSWLEKLDF